MFKESVIPHSLSSSISLQLSILNGEIIIS